MIIELLGPSIQDLFQYSHYYFDQRIICLLAHQMVKKIEMLHNIGYVHRDLKPQNFLIGLKERKTNVFLIDYGLAKKYISPIDGKCLKCDTVEKFVGSYRYASLNSHMKKTQGRREDLQALGYILIYLFKGILPWQRVDVEEGGDLEAAIYKKKSEIKIKDLCKNTPKELESYAQYCNELKFDEVPDYKYLTELFLKLLRENEGDDCSLILNWKLLKEVFFYIVIETNKENHKAAINK